jgi:hypothetical protein
LRTRIIACETVGEEMEDLIPATVPCRLLEFGLHCTPEKLNVILQKEIDQTQEDVDTILFGYGMCSEGTLGLEARNFRLVIPRVDDCIGLFLGSKAEYTKQFLKAPGTFYLTKGWIECGDDPYTEYLKMRERYGHEKAYWLEKRIIENYTRLALINTGNFNMEKYREYAKREAEFFDLTFEEIRGSNVLIKKLIQGDWDEGFVVVEPGGKVRYDMFLDDPTD